MSGTTRRRMLLESAGYLAGLGLAAIATPALAQKAKKKSFGAKEVAAAEAQHPSGVEAQVKLSAQAERLGKLILQKTRHAAALAIANPTAKFPEGSVHRAIAKNMTKVRAARLQRAKTRAQTQLSSKSASFGPYAKAELASATVKQAADVELTAALRETATQLKGAQEEYEKKYKAGEKEKDAVFTKLQFHLNSIKCIESTSGGGSDELKLGGSLIKRDGSVGAVAQHTYEEFDTGDMRYFDWELCKANPALTKVTDLVGVCPNGGANDVYRGKQIIETSLDGPGTWGLVIVAGEEDTGGFADMLADVYNAVKDEVDAALKAVAAAIGVAVGAALSTYLGPLGAAIGMAIEWALGELIGELVSWLENKDDYIAAKSFTLQLDKRTQAFIKALDKNALPSPKGTFASSMQKFTMKGDGGHYELRWHWRAVA